MTKVLLGALVASFPCLFMLSLFLNDRYHSLPACQKRAQRWLNRCRKDKLDSAFNIESLVIKFGETDLFPNAHDRLMYWQFIRQAKTCRRRELIVHGRELVRICRNGNCYPAAGELMVRIIREGGITPDELGTTSIEVRAFYALHRRVDEVMQLSGLSRPAA